MKIYEQVQELVTRKNLVKIECDRCNREIKEPAEYDTRNFELEFTQGVAYPEFREDIGWQVEDICNDCADFLEALLKHHGFKVTEINRSW